MKPRILFVNEFSALNTGYSVYGREVISRLFNSGKYDIAELACYTRPDNPLLNNVPWPVYCNMPPKENDIDNREYESKGTNQFGEFSFDDVCLDFKPHIVIDIRDHWMLSFEENSPARKYYHWMIMPTCDSKPQNEEWLSTYSNADTVFTYTDWSQNVLKEHCDRIKLAGSAIPSVADDFHPLSSEDKSRLKSMLGLGDCFIVGTVMRNQRRKLYPDLFAGFAKFLREEKVNAYLYCHTSYPDMGWDIPSLLLDNKISSRVLFTYKCRNCKASYPSFFADGLATCQVCKQNTCGLVNVNDGLENKEFNNVYNMLDAYIQPSNSEGCGIPILEAAACNLPIAVTYFSAMEDIADKLDLVKMTPTHCAIEQETGCMRAVLTENDIYNAIKKLYSVHKEKQSTREKLFNSYGNWDSVTDKWMNEIDKVDINKYEQLWKSPPDIKYSAEYTEIKNPTEFAKWLITDVLNRPDKVGSYMMQRVIRDINNGCTLGGVNGVYFTESSFKIGRAEYFPVSKEDLYKHFVELNNKKNLWESKRC